MSTTHRVAVLVGSLRTGSINRRLAEAAVSLAPEGTELTIVDGLADLPFYNEDIDIEPAPASVQAVRDTVGASDGVIFVTPEYNGTIPAVLKNAIDWLSRPYGNGAISAKPVIVAGAALSQYGGKWSHDDTRRSVKIAGGNVLEDVEVSLAASGYNVEDPSADPVVAQVLRDALATLQAQFAPAA